MKVIHHPLENPRKVVFTTHGFPDLSRRGLLPDPVGDVDHVHQRGAEEPPMTGWFRSLNLRLRTALIKFGSGFSLVGANFQINLPLLSKA